ncbi:MAG: hypothetical protein ACRDID_07535, partial [Ktedonobacterales bacterium]
MDGYNDEPNPSQPASNADPGADALDTLPGLYLGADDTSAGDHALGARHWRSLLSRWLFTLNPGRTQDEYEKAVCYFFETPGVPQRTPDVSADLLLAYRGSLALRADRRRRSQPRRAAASTRRDALWSSGVTGDALPGSGADAPHEEASGRHSTAAQPASLRQGPLSPATVNIRLTALRQYLLFAG